MKFKIHKRKLLLFSLIISCLFIFISIFLYYFLFKERVYERLFEHCTVLEEGVKKCDVFLADYKEEKGITCMEILLPETDPNRRDIEICVDGEVKWENPYKDYSSNIPITLNLYYGNTIFSKFILEKVEIEILKDEKVYEILDEIYLAEGEIFPVITKKDSQILIQGYTYYPYKRFGEGEEFLVWAFIDAKFQSIQIREDVFVFDVSFRIDDKHFNHNFTTEEFLLHTSQTGFVETLDSNSNISSYLNTEDKYIIIFSIFNSEDNQKVESYYHNLKEDVYNYFEDKENSNIYLKLEQVTR